MPPVQFVSEARRMSFVRSLGPLLALGGARAAGAWRTDGGWLVLDRFIGTDDLPLEVADAFASATAQVPLSATNLGIVGAALDKVPHIARAAELPPDAGSGYWLRAFGATISVAVPRFNRQREVAGVISVALFSGDDEPRAIAEAVGVIEGLPIFGLARDGGMADLS